MLIFWLVGLVIFAVGYIMLTTSNFFDWREIVGTVLVTIAAFAVLVSSIIAPLGVSDKRTAARTQTPVYILCQQGAPDVVDVNDKEALSVANLCAKTEEDVAEGVSAANLRCSEGYPWSLWPYRDLYRENACEAVEIYASAMEKER